MRLKSGNSRSPISIVYNNSWPAGTAWPSIRILSFLRRPDPTRFTSPSSGPRERMSFRRAGRAAHANSLLLSWTRFHLKRRPESKSKRLRSRRLDWDIPGFRKRTAFPAEISRSLDLTESGIEFCSVKLSQDNRTQATVFVPDGRSTFSLRRIAAYRDENTTARAKVGPRDQNIKILLKASAISKLLRSKHSGSRRRSSFLIARPLSHWELWLRRQPGSII